jgi:hypothetical protein
VLSHLLSLPSRTCIRSASRFCQGRVDKKLRPSRYPAEFEVIGASSAARIPIAALSFVGTTHLRGPRARIRHWSVASLPIIVRRDLRGRSYSSLGAPLAGVERQLHKASLFLACSRSRLSALLHTYAEKDIGAVKQVSQGALLQNIGGFRVIGQAKQVH